MKVFVTGATGFVGGHLARRLSVTDHDVRCLVRKPSDGRELEAEGLTPFLGDVTRRATLTPGVSGSDCVVHLANVYSMWEPDKSVFRTVNVTGTLNVLECAFECGVSRFVHVSTAGVFGRPDDNPFDEDSDVGPERFSEYAKAKYEGELAAREFCDSHSLPLVVISPGAVLGPGDTKPTGRYIEDLVKGRMPVTVYRDVVMTYVDVKDVAEAILLAMERDAASGETYLIGGHQLSFGELNRLVCEVSGTALPKINMPDAAVRATAAVLTALAGVTKRPPPLGMSVDQANMARAGLVFDGGKAVRDLGLRYTPIRETIKEVVASIRGRAGGVTSPSGS
jgi:dihydroflavonol-4-reductase